MVFPFFANCAALVWLLHAGWEVPPLIHQGHFRKYAVSESLSPTVQSPTEQSPGSDDSTTKSSISTIVNIIMNPETFIIVKHKK